jgi:hypothetical protein
MKTALLNRRMLAVAALTLASWGVRAQTDDDAIMMAKYNLCAGGMYSHSAWDYYWEGTYHRNNANLGTVTTQMVSLMGIYGITRRLAIVAGAPYVWTDASAGVLHGMHGIQDLSGWLKWEAYRQKIGSRGKLKLFGAVGGSVPMTNYLADYLPLSIGLHSRTVSGRIIADYQLGHFFATATGTYTWRSDITIDEQSYYTTQFIESDKVYMPNEETYIVRAGYRSNFLEIEANLSGMVTPGGFDIRKNDMPFPSNRMDATMAGAHARYEFRSRRLKGLSLTADGSYTVAGRNVGQSTMFGAGIFYIFDFSHRGKTLETPTLKSN